MRVLKAIVPPKVTFLRSTSNSKKSKYIGRFVSLLIRAIMSSFGVQGFFSQEIMFGVHEERCLDLIVRHPYWFHVNSTCFVALFTEGGKAEDGVQGLVGTICTCAAGNTNRQLQIPPRATFTP